MSEPSSAVALSLAGVSACIITHNEEANIERCLRSLHWADEIVVVDSFSSDGTVQIARNYTDRVFQHAWPGHIEQKNVALSYTRCDWVFALDADEVVTEELCQSITEAIGRTDYEGYLVSRRVFYLDQWIGHCGWVPEYRLRLFRREHGHWGGVNPHDRVVLSGRIGTLSGDLDHYPYKDIADHWERMGRYAAIAAAEMVRTGRRFHWWDLLMRPPARFLKMYGLRRGFLDGGVGFMVSLLGGVSVFLKYAKLWELWRREGQTAGTL
ncbi:MAG: glycosyltransferase family 2 protein [Candidatus Latescibacterota bacterium]